MNRRMPSRWFVMLLLALVAPVHAFDFNNLLDKVQRTDVNKLLEVGKRVTEATRGMSEPEEIRLGTDLAGRLLGAMPPLPDHEVQAYVNRLGRWLALQTGRPDLPWHFAVVASDSLGAFATPGGYVFVTSALVGLMRDENELAGVLAHEIAHVVERHHAEAVMKKARANLARDVAVDLVGDYTRGNPLVTQIWSKAAANLYASGLDQEDEFAADRAGADRGASRLRSLWFVDGAEHAGRARPGRAAREPVVRDSPGHAPPHRALGRGHRSAGARLSEPAHRARPFRGAARGGHHAALIDFATRRHRRRPFPCDPRAIALC